MKRSTLRINKEFEEIGTRTVDERSRLTLGELAQGARRVRILKNDRGDILLQPLVEIPASELWLFQNKDALDAVRKGLKDAASGKISRVDPKEL